MKLIRSIGLKYVEASADTECDPMYMGAAFIRDWIKEVQKESKRQGVVVKNVFSGHGTYATSGLTHYDSRVIERFCDKWMKKQIDTANELNAGFGFFAHGFEELILQDAEQYISTLGSLYETLSGLARYAFKTGMRYVSLEQMYSPHQPPWRISDGVSLLREVYKQASAPFYLTLDLGHMNGQQYFLRPDAQGLQEAILAGRRGQSIRGLWVGSAAAREMYLEAVRGNIKTDAAVQWILEDAERNPQLFSQPEDCSIEQWVRILGCYSPIMHLQQSDGKSSPHWPFTQQRNRDGIVYPEMVLSALQSAYLQPATDGMPPVCEEIVLTLEPFIGTAGNVYDLIEELRESVAYWRKWIPEDGMRLSEIHFQNG